MALQYIMRSYVTTDHNMPVLRYAVANNGTGNIIQMGMHCDEAEQLRDKLNENARRLNSHTADEEEVQSVAQPATVVVPPPAYPAQPPRAEKYGQQQERAADAILKLLEDRSDYFVISVLTISIMRIEYKHRLALNGKK